jgi:CBS domain-containing protein
MGVEELEGMKKREMLRSQIDSNDLDGMMDGEFETVDVETPLYDVLAKMKSKDLHEIPVMNGSGLAGVFSFGTLLRRKTIAVNAKAKSVMENPPEIGPEMSLTEVAEHIVSTSYRQMPVVKNGRPIGIISRKDLIKVVPKIKDLRNLVVADIMTHEVQTIRDNDALSTAVELMSTLDIRTLPVVDHDGSLSGIVGVKDVVKYNWREKQKQTVGEITGNSTPVEIKVESLSKESPVTVSPDTSLGDAVDLILKNNISTLPVLLGRDIVGIATTYDIVELIASLAKRDMVYMQITGLEEEDRHELEVMEKEIQSGMGKISKVTRPLLFTIHVSKYHEKGNSSKYSLSGRLTTEYSLYVAKAVDWNIVKATVQLMEHLDRKVIEKKEERLDKRRKG